MYGAIPSLCYTSVGYVSQLNTGRNVPVVSTIIAILTFRRLMSTIVDVPHR